VVEALIGGGVAFALGAVLLLERRCLGQIAFVQPLALCLIAGWLAGNEPLGLWLGISLQLFAAGQGPQADWSLAGVVAALAVIVAPRFGVVAAPGDPSSVALFGLAVLTATGARELERRRARLDGAALRASLPWEREDPAAAFDRLIRARVLRGLAVGGAQTVLLGAAAVGIAITAAELTFGGTARLVAALAIPTLGGAVLLGALRSERCIGIAGAGVLATLGVAALL
jgi:hypothetical protein